MQSRHERDLMGLFGSKSHEEILDIVEGISTELEIRGDTELLRKIGHDALNRSEVTSRKDIINGLLPSALESIKDYEIKLDFVNACSLAESLSHYANLTAPTLEQFSLAGVNFGQMEQTYQEMKAGGLEPSVVIAPILPLCRSYNPTSVRNWQDVYNSLTHDNSIPNNPLRDRPDVDDEGGLSIDQQLQRAELSYHQIELDLLDVDGVHIPKYSENHWPWTISILPSTELPQDLGKPHRDYENWENDATIHRLATISQYLSLQANRILSGVAPLDGYAYTKLSGLVSDEVGRPVAPYGYFHFNSGRIGLASASIDYKDITTGVRQPFYG